MLFPSRALAATLVFVSASLTLSCGSSSPTAPTAPVTAQLAGVWRGTAQTTSTAGGECFTSTFQATVGSRGPITVAFTQSGSAVSGTLTVDGTGGNYVYAGNVGASAVSLTGSSCSACNALGARCPTGTAVRDIKLQTLSVTGTVNGSAFSGSQTETYNVFSQGTSTGLGTLTLVNAFTLTRQ